jgi:hypothetical protein
MHPKLPSDIRRALRLAVRTESTETEAPEAEATTSDESGTAPDFSGCDGMTGLDNAIGATETRRCAATRA